MGRKVIDVRRVVLADPAAVWRWLGDRSTWTDWSPLGTYRLVTPGTGTPGNPGGLGSVAQFVTGRTTVLEEVVAYEPERRISYSLLEGMPLRGYRADVDLRAVEGGTEVRWHSAFDPARPGTGWMYAAVLRVFIKRMLAGLAERVAQPTTVAGAA
jgi:hypothetical protein